MINFLQIRDKDFPGLSLGLRAGHWLDCRRRMVCGSRRTDFTIYRFGGKPTMSNELPKMPDPAENDSFIPPLNQQGAIWLYVDEITRAYLNFVGERKVTLLEVAAGYGHIVIEALEAGAKMVFANEIDAAQLAIIKARTPAQYADKLVYCPGQFPEHLDFPDCSFDGIYNARLFHFFDGDRIRASLAKFQRWLKPGGRVFSRQ